VRRNVPYNPLKTEGAFIMFKWSTTLTSLVLVICAGMAANATDDATKDPKGLLRISSTLLLAADAEDGDEQLHAQGLGLLLEEDDRNKPSNTNAPREEETAPPRAAAVALTNAEEKEARKYVFGDEDLTEGKLKPRLIAGPLLTLLQELKGGIAKTPAEMEKGVQIAGTPVHKLVYRYKEKRFLTQNQGTDLFSITPLGRRVLELLEANYKLGGDKHKKRSRSEDEDDDNGDDDEEEFEDDVDSSDHAVAKAAAPKKVRTSGSILPGQMKKPEMHHAILAALKNGRANVATIRESLSEARQENKNLSIHLGTQMGYKWLTRKLDEGEFVYKLTSKGQRALKELGLRIGDDPADEEDDEEEVLQKKASTSQKRQREEEEDDSSELISNQLKRPEFHYGILNALGRPGKYLNAEYIFKSMGKHKPTKRWKDLKDNFINYYLANHLTKGWLEKVYVDGENHYAITDKGVRVQAKLLELIPEDEDQDQDEDEDEDEDDESSSSSSSSEPVKKKAASAKPQPATAPAPGKKLKVTLKDVAKPASSKPAPASTTRARQPIEGPDNQPHDDRANEWGEGEAAAGVIKLDDLPEPLQRHLMGQVEGQFAAMMADANLITELRRTIVSGLHNRLAEEFFRLFETHPGDALKNFLSQNVTITITRNGNNK
jgi:DNA-binding PadR family transcriptional regulator